MDPLRLGPVEMRDYDGTSHLTRNQCRLLNCIHMNVQMVDMWYIPMLDARLARIMSLNDTDV